MGAVNGSGHELPFSRIAGLANRLRAHAESLSAALGLDSREARIEAQVLAAHGLGVDRAWLIAHDRDLLTHEQARAVDSLIARRASGQPVAYLLGKREFYGRTFRVTPDVLIPRPDTELLVEAALASMPGGSGLSPTCRPEGRPTPVRVLDLGTGSGCIAITLALEAPASSVWAVDRSAAALAVARENAERLCARLCFLASDWFTALSGERFDLIVANPPYVADADPHLQQGDLRFEPRAALAAGNDGLDDLRAIVAGAPAHLSAGGSLLVEHGWEQGAVCRELFAREGFVGIATLADLAGSERVTLGRRP